nr:MAG TPA: hypothetical protein [Bacteriophage sp.]
MGSVFKISKQLTVKHIEAKNSMFHNHEVPGSIPGPATQNKVFMSLFHGCLVFLLFYVDLFFFS